MSLASNSSKIARDQQARSWELRTARDLARLWHQQGRSAEALRLHKQFSEGFDGADLKCEEALQVELDASASR